MWEIFYDVNVNGFMNMIIFVILKCYGFGRDLWLNGYIFFRDKNKCYMLFYEFFRVLFVGNLFEVVI